MFVVYFSILKRRHENWMKTEKETGLWRISYANLSFRDNQTANKQKNFFCYIQFSKDLTYACVICEKRQA